MGRLFAVVICLIYAIALGSCRTMHGSGDVIYKIKVSGGDTLSSLALKYDTKPESIARLNKINVKDGIYIGQILLIKPGPAGRLATSEKSINKPANSDIGRKKRGGLFFKSSNYDSSASIWPVRGVVTSEFGWRAGRRHEGIDIGAPSGTAIRTVESGVVEYTGWKRGYGRIIVVKHDGYKTAYAHCSRIKVKRGDTVTRGEVIATVGSSGNATAPHLHFEYRKGEKKYNPRHILPNRVAMR